MNEIHLLNVYLVLKHLLIISFVSLQRRFPADNFAEWNNGHPLGLRTVHAYVLVFDMGNLETFQVSTFVYSQDFNQNRI